MIKHICTALFYLLGWKLQGTVPTHLKKGVLIVSPHTSNWDFIIAIITRGMLDLPVRFLGKHTLFNAPYGFIFKALGGYPVNRSKSHNLVDDMVKAFNTHDEFILSLAPEGTRSAVTRWKTGFYYIAKQAKVPIVMAGMDYATKQIIISDAFYPSNNQTADFEHMYAFFYPIKGKYPEKALVIPPPKSA